MLDFICQKCYNIDTRKGSDYMSEFWTEMSYYWVEVQLTMQERINMEQPDIFNIDDEEN